MIQDASDKIILVQIIRYFALSKSFTPQLSLPSALVLSRQHAMFFPTVNASGGNLILAAELFGNSPNVAKKNYYTGINKEEALEVLNKRKFS